MKNIIHYILYIILIIYQDCFLDIVFPLFNLKTIPTFYITKLN